MRVRAFLAFLLLLPLGSTVFNAAHAAEVTVDDGSTRARSITANDPANGNVWTSLAQSFTATNSQIRFGFRLTDIDSSLPDAGAQITYDLYSGESFSGIPLASRTVVMPSTLSDDPRSAFGDVGFVEADFSSVLLDVGYRYTVRISTPASGVPPIGSYSGISVWTSIDDPYPGGRFFFPAGYDNTFFESDDMLFHMEAATGTSSQAAFALGEDIAATSAVPAGVRTPLGVLANVAGIDLANRTQHGTLLACQLMDRFISYAEKAVAGGRLAASYGEDWILRAEQLKTQASCP